MYRRELENVSDETILKRRKAEIVSARAGHNIKHLKTPIGEGTENVTNLDYSL